MKKTASNIIWFLKPIRAKGINNEFNIDSLLRNGKIRIKCDGNNNKVIIDKRVYIEKLYINILGDNNFVYISSDCHIYNLSVKMNGDCRFVVGANVSIRKADIVIWEKQTVEIGKNSMISFNVNIRTSDSHFIFDNTTRERINYGEKIIIGKHVWIAQNVTLLKGTHIGNDSVVGFGSICSKQYPHNCIIAGVPGKIIKENIDWSRDLV